MFNLKGISLLEIIRMRLKILSCFAFCTLIVCSETAVGDTPALDNDKPTAIAVEGGSKLIEGGWYNFVNGLGTDDRAAPTLPADDDILFDARSTSSFAPRLAPISGARKALVIIVEWDGDASNPPVLADVSRDEAKSWVDEYATPYFQLISRGLFQGWQTTAAGPYLIRSPKLARSICDDSWRIYLAGEADAAARSVGINPDSFDNIIYYNSHTNACPRGNAELGGKRAWLDGLWNDEDYLVTHELGHNLGVHHSHGTRCVDVSGAPVPFSANCMQVDYEDRYSVMGRALPLPYNVLAAQHLNTLGWFFKQGDLENIVFDPRRPPTHYYLAPLEQQSSPVLKALKIVNGETTFWVEYRQSASPWSPGLIIRREDPVDGKTFLLDMHPGGSSGFVDAPLAAGETWTYGAGAMSIFFRGVVNGYASISVSSTYTALLNVVGTDVIAAIQRLRTAGFNVINWTSKIDRSCNYIDLVMSQWPTAGTRSPSDTNVRLTVGVKPSGRNVCP
ncbi:hypothetical protein NTGBS_220017 [Candidatus Nitrotoga sp. BS]|uniref:hypothetical protein n=1 Tax=Candidatus Nitrotoga sp. BS TaxID=2890408 RepID=UPI001EF295E0|nr:hypothetical protein [Candidatus Nitrotoga sp. BS]CAH1197026.1 hypothetical protein NTGBS_220017 [Candidatus Nitrotoga sp. BS]